MRRTALWGAAAILASALVVQFVLLRRQEARLRAVGATHEADVRDLQLRLQADRSDTISRCETRVREAAAEAARAAEEADLSREEAGALRGELTADLETLRAQVGAVRDTLQRYSENVQTGLQGTSQDVSSLRATLDRVEGSIHPDARLLVRRLIQPSVQVDGRDTVGGGTVIHSAPGSGSEQVAEVLTAYHVVQKVVQRMERHETTDPVQVRVYREDGSSMGDFPAEVLAYEPHKDMALLRVRLPEAPPEVAALAPRDRLHALGVFSPVYAVGCPLGHDPMPTQGEVSTTHKVVNGESFWMVSAPTIFGNSGGGIFDHNTLELIGISALICTYDGVVSTPVPHMSIMVSLETVYDWLDSLNLAWLYQDEAPAAAPAPPASGR